MAVWGTDLISRSGFQRSVRLLANRYSDFLPFYIFLRRDAMGTTTKFIYVYIERRAKFIGCVRSRRHTYWRLSCILNK